MTHTEQTYPVPYCSRCRQLTRLLVVRIGDDEAAYRTPTAAAAILGRDRGQYLTASVRMGDDVPVTLVGHEAHLAPLLDPNKPAHLTTAPRPTVLQAYGAYGESYISSWLVLANADWNM